MAYFCTYPMTATSNITTDLPFDTLKCNNFKIKSGKYVSVNTVNTTVYKIKKVDCNNTVKLQHQ